ncbi:MAG: hypothetical protein R2755_23920 [Acidimicrobiales bacterium]
MLAGIAWQVPAFFLTLFLVLGLAGGENGPGWLDQAPAFDEAIAVLALLLLPLAAGAAALMLLARWAVREPYRRSTMAVTLAAALLQPGLVLLLSLA